MKKILIIILFLLFSEVNALVIPDNVYYVDNGLYAYLNYNQEIDYCSGEECTLYIEYEYKEADSLTYQSLDKIEVNQEKKILLLEPNVFDFEKILIRSRYLTINSLGNYTYSEWTEDKNISSFSIDQLPTPKIKELDLAGEQLYKIDNELEINNYLKEYLKYYDEEIIYSLQYRINEEEWLEGTIPTDLDLGDIKIEIRIKYTVGEEESKLSNVLVYEKHPIIEQCLFDSSFCCNKILNISACLWLIILFIISVISLIAIENINRRKREA